MAIQKIAPGAYGADVASLQEFLRRQGYQLPASEVNRAFYGPLTRQAVQQYQQNYGLPATGAVDEDTANSINASLGPVKLQKAAPVAALPHAPLPSAGTVAGGAPPTGTAISASAPSPQPAQEENRGTVQGKLVDQDGAPIADTRVSAFAKLLRAEEPLGSTQTNKQGQYSISYERPGAVNIILRAYDGSGKIIAQSPVVYDSAATAQIDFTTAADGIVRTPSIFTTLQAKVQAQLQGIPFEDLKENKDTHEIHFLANAIGAQFGDVASLFISYVLAKQNKLRDETLFGIFEQGVPASLRAALTDLPDAGIDSAFMSQVLGGVLAHSRVSLAQTLTAAVNANIIPASYAATQDAELNLLDSLRVQSVQSGRFVRGKTSVNDLLNAGSVSGAVQSAFTQAYADNRGDLGATWKVLRANPNLPSADLATLQTTLRLGESLVGNLVLFRDTIARLNQKTLANIQDLALLDQADWVTRITALDPGATSIPPVLPGETPQQRISRLAKTLANDFAVKYPTTAFVGGLMKAANSSFKTKPALVQFLNTNPKFTFTRTNIDRYLAANKLTPEREVIKDLKTAQRLFRVSPQYPIVEALKTSGYESAQSVYFKGRGPFLAHMAGPLGSGSLAQSVYAKAQITYATALMAYGRYNVSLNGVQTAVMQSSAPNPDTIATLPDLQALFGSLDCFECDDCQSVYSPAAYLVDLLQYLAQFSTNQPNLNGRDALFLRRPDIQYIALNCNNTNTTLPYIDVVNEILEAAVAPPSTPITFIDTLGTSAERRALPQQISQQAYQNAASAIFPLSLPFDLPFVQTKAYCAALHTSWDAILGLFVFPPTSAGASDTTIACASLGINPEMQTLIRIPDVEHPWLRWGLLREFRSVIDPNSSPPAPYKPSQNNWVGALNKVPVFLNRSGLSLLQLYQLLEAVWVTHSGVTLQLGTTTYAGVLAVSPDANDMVFTGLALEVLDRANRFIRLWRAAGLQMWELDWAFEHLTASLPNLDRFFVFLAGAKFVSSTLKLPFPEVLSFWMPLETRDVTNHLGAEDAIVASTYTEVFRNPAVLSSWGLIFVPLMANTITGASNTSPITITTASPHGYVSGAQVAISGVGGNTAANGTFTIAVTSPTTFTLAGSAGNAAWTTGGTAVASLSGNPIIPQSSSASPTQEQNAITAALALSADDISAILAFTGASNTLCLDTLNVLLRYQRLVSSLALDISDLILWIQLTAATPFGAEIPITAATNASPIAVTTMAPHGLQTGAQVSINGAAGNTAANGTFTVTVTGENSFTLNGSRGNGNWTSGGIVAVNGPTDTLEFLRRLAVLRGTRIALHDLDYLLRNQSVSQSTLAFTPTQATAVLQAIRDAIASLPVPASTSSYDPAAIQTIFLSALAIATAVSSDVIGPVLLKLGVLPLDSATIAHLIGQGSGVDPTQFPSLINAINAVAKAAALFSALKPTGAEFTFIVQNAGAFGWLDPSGLPLASVSQSPYAQFESLLRALKLNRLQTARTPKIFDVLGQWLACLPANPTIAIAGNQFTVAGASYTTPITITTATPHGLQNGMQVAIYGVSGNTAANGTFVVTVTGQSTFTLNSSTGNAAWTDGGIVTVILGTQLTVSGASNATPIIATTTKAHGLQTGMQVTITGVAGNTAANGTFTVTVTGASTFALNGSSGNGAWTSGGAITVIFDSLALALNGSVADVTAIANALGATTPSLAPASQPGSLADMAMLTSISSALNVCARYGVSGPTLVQLSTAPATRDTASAAKTVLQAQYTQDKWFAAIQPTEDALRESRRDALVAFLLASWAAVDLRIGVVDAIETTDDIFDEFLIDPEMSSCALTTRLLEASLAIQQFVEQAFLNFQAKVILDMSNKQLTDEWAWRQQYRLWQANREVFLYPENYLLPELRKNASPFFSDLENDLRQSDCNADAAESAIANYLRNLVNVSRLVVAAHYNQKNSDGSTVLYVFARTQGTPPQWFYRARTAGPGNPSSGTWSAWESLNLDIGSSPAFPVIWDGRLHLIWPILKQISEKQKSQDVPAQGGSGASSPPPQKFWVIEFAMSELSTGQWQPKRTISEKMFLDIQDPPLSFTFQAFQDSNFNLTINVYFDAIEEAVFAAIMDVVFDLLGASPGTSATHTAKAFSATATAQGYVKPDGNNSIAITSSSGTPGLVAQGVLSMPEAPLSVAELNTVLPDRQLVDTGQEPTFALVTVSPLTGQLAIPAQYGFSGQDLVYGNYTTTNPGTQPLNVLCTMTANGQPTTVQLLGTITNPRIVIPQQEGIFDSADPFFVADPNRTYFVLPQYSTISSSPRPLPGFPSYGSWSTSYVFQTFYHPYARMFLR
jgi:hypothetical protein